MGKYLRLPSSLFLFLKIWIAAYSNKTSGMWDHNEYLRRVNDHGNIKMWERKMEIIKSFL